MGILNINGMNVTIDFTNNKKYSMIRDIVNTLNNYDKYVTLTIGGDENFTINDLCTIFENKYDNTFIEKLIIINNSNIFNNFESILKFSAILNNLYKYNYTKNENFKFYNNSIVNNFFDVYTRYLNILKIIKKIYEKYPDIKRNIYQKYIKKLYELSTNDPNIINDYINEFKKFTSDEEYNKNKDFSNKTIEWLNDKYISQLEISNQKYKDIIEIGNKIKELNIKIISLRKSPNINKIYIDKYMNELSDLFDNFIDKLSNNDETLALSKQIQGVDLIRSELVIEINETTPTNKNYINILLQIIPSFIKIKINDQIYVKELNLELNFDSINDLINNYEFFNNFNIINGYNINNLYLSFNKTLPITINNIKNIEVGNIKSNENTKFKNYIPTFLSFNNKLLISIYNEQIPWEFLKVIIQHTKAYSEINKINLVDSITSYSDYNQYLVYLNNMDVLENITFKDSPYGDLNELFKDVIFKPSLKSITFENMESLFNFMGNVLALDNALNNLKSITIYIKNSLTRPSDEELRMTGSSTGSLIGTNVYNYYNSISLIYDKLKNHNVIIEGIESKEFINNWLIDTLAPIIENNKIWVKKGCYNDKTRPENLRADGYWDPNWNRTNLLSNNSYYNVDDYLKDAKKRGYKIVLVHNIANTSEKIQAVPLYKELNEFYYNFNYIPENIEKCVVDESLNLSSGTTIWVLEDPPIITTPAPSKRNTTPAPTTKTKQITYGDWKYSSCWYNPAFLNSPTLLISPTRTKIRDLEDKVTYDLDTRIKPEDIEFCKNKAEKNNHDVFSLSHNYDYELLCATANRNDDYFKRLPYNYYQITENYTPTDCEEKNYYRIIEQVYTRDRIETFENHKNKENKIKKLILLFIFIIIAIIIINKI